MKHPLDLCFFTKNPPQFMRKTLSETCAVLDLCVVLPPPTKFLDSYKHQNTSKMSFSFCKHENASQNAFFHLLNMKTLHKRAISFC